jgi:hypothetical protein
MAVAPFSSLSTAAMGDHRFSTTVCFGMVVVAVFVVVVAVCAVVVAAVGGVTRFVPQALHFCFFGLVCNKTQSLFEHNQ